MNEKRMVSADYSATCGVCEVRVSLMIEAYEDEPLEYIAGFINDVFTVVAEEIEE